MRKKSFQDKIALYFLFKRRVLTEVTEEQFFNGGVK